MKIEVSLCFFNDGSAEMTVEDAATGVQAALEISKHSLTEEQVSMLLKAFPCCGSATYEHVEG